MLKISDAQIEDLTETTFSIYQTNKIQQLRQDFPDRVREATDDALRDFIRFGRDRAARHGFAVQAEYCLFITLMCVFGPRFDEDPKLPWATAILGDGTFSSSAAKISYLYSVAGGFAAKALGDDHPLDCMQLI